MHKQNLKLSLDKYNDYGMRNFSSSEMAILGMFLTTDYYVYPLKFLLDWAQDSEQDGTNANITYLEKRDDMVAIGDLLNIQYDNVLEMPAGKFIKLLNDWERITKQRPKEIIITKDGDNVTVEGKN